MERWKKRLKLVEDQKRRGEFAFINKLVGSMFGGKYAKRLRPDIMRPKVRKTYTKLA